MSQKRDEAEMAASRQLTVKQRKGIEARLHNNPVLRLFEVSGVDFSPGTATLRLQDTERFHNSMGVVQGGILGVLADAAGGFALYTVLEDPLQVFIPTIEFKLNFLRPAKSKELFARGRVVHRGKKVALSEVEVLSASGDKLAVGLFTFFIVPSSRVNDSQ